jgi:hypothetical protein
MMSQLLIVLLGLWLMASPDVLHYDDPARTLGHIVGPLIVSVALIAVSEVTRPVRWVNVLFGVGLIAASWMPANEPAARWNGVVIGALVIALSVRRGPIKEQVGGGWRVLWRRRTEIPN